MCYKVVKYENLFKSFFLDCIKDLATDKVLGVRICVARLISHQFVKSNTLSLIKRKELDCY